MTQRRWNVDLRLSIFFVSIQAFQGSNFPLPTANCYETSRPVDLVAFLCDGSSA